MVTKQSTFSKLGAIVFFALFSCACAADDTQTTAPVEKPSVNNSENGLRATPQNEPKVTPKPAPQPTMNPKSSIQLIARIRSYKAEKPIDIQDSHIYSPKSAIFTKDGKKLYINSLEGCETIVYDFPELKQRKVIKHTFNADNSHLFQNDENTIFDYKFYVNTGKPNHFSGKPVESVLSHDGRYLWATYYRRSYDANATSPSAIAVIDTTTDEIVRVMPTGPLPKVVTVSPDGKTLAVVHWGDNSVALMDVSSNDPKDFHYTNRLELNRQKNLSNISGDRDRFCGECLRGAAFTPDGKNLFVARMGGGAIAVFDVPNNRYLGSIVNVARSPRHIALNNDGSILYVTSNRSGIVTRFNVSDILNDINKKGGNTNLRGKEIFVGSGARTFALSPDEKSLYVVSNLGLKVSEIDTESWKITDWNGAYAYPVGLAVSPDGNYLVTTSQGRERRGGNTVGVYKIEQKH